MSLPADTLLDRLYLKSQLTRWRLLAIAACLVALVAVFERGGGKVTGGGAMERSYVARFAVEGVILDDLQRDELMAEIRDNSAIKALIVRLDTPGGSAVGGHELFLQLRAIAEKKPVVAVMRDLSASAGYLTAVGADRIYAREGTLTGSIGVIIQTAEFTSLAEKLGITPITIKTGPFKDALSPVSKTTPEAMQLMQGVVDDFYQKFVDIVAERRGLPREAVLKVADGRVLTGRQALSNRLIDALGGEAEAINWLEREKKLPADLPVYDVEVKKPPLPWLERLAESAMQPFFPQSAARELDGLVAIWHPSVQLQ